jgi:hypothetical protein
MTTRTPFASITRLEQQFADGLDAMLAAHTRLGVYILVLANAAYDEALWTRLAPVLAARHVELATSVTAALRDGARLTEPEDDLLVFLKLLAIGFQHLQKMSSREVAPWIVAFNPLRALRPPRHSAQAFSGLLRPFDTAQFHFNKPFLAREIFWHGELADRPARLLYNKFPFARLHGILVPDPQRELPQYLDEAGHRWAWTVCESSSIAGLCLGYNSQGAGASVNQLHFQSFVQQTPLPVQHVRFTHNGGSASYPLPCWQFGDMHAAWQTIEHLNRLNTPYNLIYSPGRVHLVARASQDSAALPPHIRSYGWSEMAGVVTRFSRDAYDAFSADAFSAELAAFALPQTQATVDTIGNLW